MRKSVVNLIVLFFFVLFSSASSASGYMLVQLNPLVNSNVNSGKLVSYLGSLEDLGVDSIYTRSTEQIVDIFNKEKRIVPFLLESRGADEISISPMDAKPILTNGFNVCLSSFICAFELSSSDIEKIKSGAAIKIAYQDSYEIPSGWFKLATKKYFHGVNCGFGRRCAIATKVAHNYVGEISLIEGSPDVCLPINSGYVYALYKTLSLATSTMTGVKKMGVFEIPYAHGIKFNVVIPGLNKLPVCIKAKYLPAYLHPLSAAKNIKLLNLYSAYSFKFVSDNSAWSKKIKIKRSDRSAIKKASKVRLDKGRKGPIYDEYVVEIDYSEFVGLLQDIYETSGKILIEQAALTSLGIALADQTYYVNYQNNVQPFVVPVNRGICRKMAPQLEQVKHIYNVNILKCN